MRLNLNVSLSLCICVTAHAQNAPFNQFNGVASTQISSPTSVSVAGCPAGGATTWTYSMAAVDASGNSTSGTSASTSAGCVAPLSSTNYNLIIGTAPLGAVTCNIYRTTGGTTGLVASIPCGAATPAMYIDQNSTTVINSSSPPSLNSTGGLSAKGTVAGSNFLASGSGAGTSDWVQGSALSACTQGIGTVLTQPQPCIQTTSFFLQAASSIPSSFGWTAPSMTNSAAGPVIAGPNNGATPPASPLSIGFLTDTTVNSTNQPTVATVTGSLNAGHLASITNPSGSNYDFVDSGIATSSVGLLGSAQTFTAAQTFSATPTSLTASGQVKAAGYVDTSIGFLASNMTAQTTTTPTPITNMAWAIAASKNYRLDCEIVLAQAASATVSFELIGPGSPSSFNLFMEGPLGSGGVYKEIGVTAQTGWANPTGPDVSTTATIGIHVKAQIQNGTTASGTNLQLETIANGTNGITVLAGSLCVLTQAN